MTTALLSEIVGQRGLFQLLQVMDDWDGAFPSMKVFTAMENLDIVDSDVMLEHLTQAGLLTVVGGNLLSMTTKGQRTLLLLQAINGSDIQEVYRRLATLYPRWAQYQVVRDRMTQDFIRELYDRPDFRRLYLCSRWIHLEKRPRGRLAQAVFRASERQNVEILVIHGPLSRDSQHNARLKETLDFLKSLGAEIVLNPKVHAKLYIREPGLSGGLQAAVVGSENLTVPKYAELGLKIINDGEMINKLIGVFFDIYSGQSY